MPRIERALISTWNKSGVEDLGRGLAARGIEILSTGGTARVLAKAGVEVIEIADYTGHPEILDGRVKTLQARIHGGLLAQRDDPAHCETMREHDIPPIDLLAVNLYPFVETVAREGVTLAEAIETIDIGGPAMLRAAAKNWRYVAIPKKY